MAKLGYCSIDNLKLSSRSKDAVKEIQYIAEQSNHLVIALGAVPILDIFLGRNHAADKLINIAGYDWVEYSKTIQGAGKVTKERIRKIATMEALYTHGEEGLFWRCVADASL